MMKALGIILAGGGSSRLGDLSKKRAVAAMPIAGSYRCIDFALSSMSNSHVQKVAVFTQYNSSSTATKEPRAWSSFSAAMRANTFT